MKEMRENKAATREPDMAVGGPSYDTSNEDLDRGYTDLSKPNQGTVVEFGYQYPPRYRSEYGG